MSERQVQILAELGLWRLLDRLEERGPGTTFLIFSLVRRTNGWNILKNVLMAVLNACEQINERLKPIREANPDADFTALININFDYNSILVYVKIWIFKYFDSIIINY